MMHMKDKGKPPSTGALVARFVIVFIVVLVVKMLLWVILWAWLVPDIFPSAVAQGLIVRTLPWTTAFKLGLIGAVVAVLIKLKMYCCWKKYAVHKDKMMKK